MKYVMLETTQGSGSTKQLVPIIFPDFMVHSLVAEAVGKMLEDAHLKKVSVRSAGSVNLGHLACDGMSETLRVMSHEDDADTIMRYDYFHGLA